MASLASLTSVSSLQSTIAFAERKVQQGQNQVQQDSDRLAQSRLQLDRDQEQVRQAQQQSRQAGQSEAAAAATPKPVNTSQAIQIPVPTQQVVASNFLNHQPQINAQGQTIGRLINVTA